MQNGPMTQPILNGGEFDGDEGWGIIMEGCGQKFELVNVLVL